jgi:hypothetical protein
MSITSYLEVNGSLRGGDKDTRWFQLPGKRYSASSVRFGNHALVLDETMQILPLGDWRGLPKEPRARAAGEIEQGRTPAFLSSSRWLSLLM